MIPAQFQNLKKPVGSNLAKFDETPQVPTG